MPTVETADAMQPGTALAGSILRPGDDGYEEARRIHNGLVDRRPAVIARCATADGWIPSKEMYDPNPMAGSGLGQVATIAAKICWAVCAVASPWHLRSCAGFARAGARMSFGSM